MMCAFFSAIYSIQPKPLIDLWGVVPVASWGMMASGIAGLVVCLEPTSAYVFGIMFMNLKLGWIECLGIAMVISQVFILSIRSKKRS